MKNIILIISVIYLVSALDFRVAEAVGPSKGEMTKNDVFVGNNCIVDSLTVKWNLDSLLGEAVVAGSYKYEGNCEPASDFMVWLKVEGSGGWGFVRIAPVVPEKPNVWGFNTPGSPEWKEAICGYKGNKREKCVPVASAKQTWKTGKVTDFHVPWSGTGSKDAKKTEDTS